MGKFYEISVGIVGILFFATFYSVCQGCGNIYISIYIYMYLCYTPIGVLWGECFLTTWAYTLVQYKCMWVPFIGISDSGFRVQCLGFGI